MCGIVGIIKKDASFSLKARDSFKGMLYADALRGIDGTGVMSVKGNKVNWMKSATPVWEFFGIDKVPPYINNIDENLFVVGHNRASTRGAKVNANAHPFQVKHICGVHNGTLSSTWEFKVDNKIEVDSEMLYTAIARDGIRAIAPRIQGSYSLVWHNTETEKLYFLRNKERPMFFAKIKDPEMWMFGSEVGLLRWIAARKELDITEEFSTEPHLLYKFKEGNLKPSVEKVKAYEPRVYNHGASHWPHHNNPEYGRSFGYGGLDSDDYCGDFQRAEEAKPAIEQAPIPVSKPLPIAQQIAQVFPFPKSNLTEEVAEKHKKKALNDNYRRWLGRLSTTWKVGEGLVFSIFDYGNKIPQGNFVPIIGRHPRWAEEVIVKGNFNGDETSLVETTCLMAGIITQIHVLKKENKILIGVKDVKHTQMPDPELKKEDKPVQVHEVAYLGKFICCECGQMVGPGIRPFTKRTNNMTEYICPDCLDGGQSKGCASCSLVKERCAFFIDGDCDGKGNENEVTRQ